MRLVLFMLILTSCATPPVDLFSECNKGCGERFGTAVYSFQPPNSCICEAIEDLDE